MKYLLDTHVLLWANMSPERLSAAGREAVESRQVKLSVVSLWELILKKNRAGAPVRDPLLWWERYVARASVEVLPIRTQHLSHLDSLPEFHGDPFDRMLIAQAQSEQLQIVTADVAFAKYEVTTLW